MFDLGMTELMVVGVVALIVVGPKDLPVLFRRAGEFVGKMRGMAREFSSAMNDAADESGVRDTAKDLKKMMNPGTSAFSSIKDAAKSATDLTALDPTSETGKLSAERQEAANKIHAKAARAQAERKAKEAAEALAKAEELEAKVTPPAAPKAPAKKPAAKKPAVKKAPAKKPAAKKPAPKAKE